MATQTTGGGSTTSFLNTPQAKDDTASAYEDYVFTFDVMANDLGGNAKILWSIDDTDMQDDSTTVVYDLLAQDTAASIPEYSDLGAKIRIVNGKIQYDTNSIDWLGEGETAIDTFTYAIRLANGTLSWATVTVTLTGRNDAPAIVAGGDDAGVVTEDTDVTVEETLSDSGSFQFTDVDLIDEHEVTVTASEAGYLGTLTAEITDPSTDDGSGEVTWTFEVDNSAVQYLGDGETLEQTYTIEVSDGNGGTAQQTVTITITGTNDRPTLTIDDASGDMDEGDDAEALLSSGIWNSDDVDTNDIVTISATYNDDIDWSHGDLDATLAAALVAGFTYDQSGWEYGASEDLDFLGAGETITFTFTVVATDDSGTSTDTSDPQTVTITITGTNDAPVVDAGIDDQQSNEDSAWLFTVPSDAFADIDHGDELTLSATLEGGGDLPAWLEFDEETRTFSGTPPQDFNGTLNLTVTASDGDESVSDTFTLTVVAVNDAPVNTIAGYSTNEDTAKALTGLSVADVDAGGGTITVTLSVNSGTLAAIATASVGVSGSGSDTIELTGTLAAINAFLAATAPVFTPAANANGNVTLTMTTDDGGNTGIGGAQTDTDAVTITVVAVNDAPVNTIAGYSTNEDTAKALTGLSVADVDAGGGTITVTLSVNSGTLAAIATASVGVSGSGSDTIELTGTLAAINAFLAATAPVFTPAANANGNVTLTMTTDDGGNTGIGGAQTDTDAATISVAAVNDPASVSGDDAKEIDEDASPNTVSGNLDSTDVDGVDDSWQAATIASVNGYGTLVINANGTWTYTLDNTNTDVDDLDDDEELTDMFTVKTADGTEHTITITINGNTDAPAGETRVNDAANDKDFDDPSQIAIFNGATVRTGDFAGGGGDDIILGNANAQALLGQGGGDTIHGAGGGDTISGGGGNDTLYGGTGNDGITGGGGNDTIYGGSGDDTISGNDNSETVYGGSGNDNISGNAGQDQLWGGTGQDDFIFAGTDTSLLTRDKINDFSHAEGDRIDLSPTSATSFVGIVLSAAAVGANQVGYVVNGDGSLTVYIDTNGIAGAEMAIDVVGVGSLQSSDFVF